MTNSKELIQDNQTFVSAQYASGYPIAIYDDGYGPLWISRNSIGINGIVRARSWEDAYSICEDEFFPEADETLEQIKAEYGFQRKHVKIVNDNTVTVADDDCGIGERLERYPEDYPNGKLVPVFVRWATIETPDPESWPDNELFQESFGFRPNGPNKTDKLNHGIYAKDLSGDCLDLLTPQMLEEMQIQVTVKNEDDDELPDGFSVESTTDDRYLVLCKGIQWGKGPRDLSGCSSETWPTREDAIAAIREREE